MPLVGFGAKEAAAEAERAEAETWLPPHVVDIEVSHLRVSQPAPAPPVEPPPPIPQSTRGTSVSSFDDGSMLELSLRGRETDADEHEDKWSPRVLFYEWLNFFRSVPGLPRSCRLFLACSCAAVLLITIHALIVLATANGIETFNVTAADYGGQWANSTEVCPAEVFTGVEADFDLVLRCKKPLERKLIFYGVTQLLSALLALYFTIFALRRENEVEIGGAI